MNTKDLMLNAVTWLKTAQTEIKSRNYDTALDMLAEAYSNVRSLMELVYELKRTASAAERPAGEATDGH